MQGEPKFINRIRSRTVQPIRMRLWLAQLDFMFVNVINGIHCREVPGYRLGGKLAPGLDDIACHATDTLKSMNLPTSKWEVDVETIVLSN